MSCMTKPKPKDAKQPERKPARMCRIRESLAIAVDALVERNSSDFSEEVNRAIREYLERQNLWPPK